MFDQQTLTVIPGINLIKINNLTRQGEEKEVHVSGSCLRSRHGLTLLRNLFESQLTVELAPR